MSKVSGQSKSVAIKGDILTEDDIPIANCNIKIASRKTKLILAFFNTGSINSFSKTFSATINDTVVITVSHTGFISQTEELVIENNKNQLPIIFSLKLKYNIHQLEEVKIVPIPVWNRGDTTFFKVDSFKIGNERKLIDLLLKLPGFTITGKGLLMFKGRLVEKILLEGEEIFADKIKLMLQNVPINNINTIQALENQTNNKLLKGLINDNKVFLNLSFKKGRKNLLFGDMEAGIRTDEKYCIASNLFSLQKKIKLGFIGNSNSTGYGIFEYEFTPFFSEPIRNSWTNMISLNNLQYVFELSGDRYLQNKLYSNNLQVNYRISKKIYTKTEINIIKDRLTQNTFHTSRIFGNNNFFSREDQNSILYRPEYYIFKQYFQISPDSLSSLNIAVENFFNKSQSNFSTIISQNAASYGTNNFIKNNSTSSIITVDYSKRISPEKAITLNVSYNVNKLPQSVNGYSKDWYNLFLLPDPTYTLLTNNFFNTHKILSLNFESIFKRKGITKTFIIEAYYARYNIANVLTFKDKDSNLPTIGNAVFSTNGDYEISKILGQFFVQTKINNRVFTGLINAGLSGLSLNDMDSDKSIINPVVISGISGKKSYNKFISDEIDIKYNQSTPGLIQLNSVYMPSHYIGFFRNRNAGIQNKNIQGTYRIYSGLKNFNSLTLSLTANKSLTGRLSDPLYLGFISLRNDSVVRNKGNSGISLSLNINIHTFKFFTLIKFGFALQKNNGLLFLQDKISRIKYSTNELYLDLQRNWRKKIFLSNYFVVKFINNKLIVPGLESKSNLANLFNTFSFRYFLSKKIDIKYSFEALNNNLYSQDNSFYFLSNINFQYFFAKRKMTFSLKLNNITNEKNYFGIGANNEFVQNVYKIPLVKRNLFIAFSYEF